MKIFCAGIVTETNGFVSRLTTLADFSGSLFVGLSDQSPDCGLSFAAQTWERLVKARGHEFVVGLLAGAMPGGPTERSAYEAMRNALLDDLIAAAPVDAVLLDLHGAMMAEGYPDVEGDLIKKVREKVGPAVPIGVHLDLHCHLSQKMIDHSTIIITMKEWPHTDISERATEVLDAIEGVVSGLLQPVMSVSDCRMIGCYPTVPSPMCDLVERMRRLEKNEKIISVSLVHGFPYADNPDVGSKTLVVTNDAPALGARIAKDVCRELWSIRNEIMAGGHISIDEALHCATHSEYYPLVLCDQADSVAGGASGDSTFLLRAFTDAGVENVVFGPIWDPVCLDLCRQAGEGAKLSLSIGGKAGPESGEPVELEVEVRGYLPNLVQDPIGEISAMKFGEAIWLRTNKGTDIVLHSKRAPTFLPSVIEDLGIDLGAKSVVICKMWRHGEAGFAHVAGLCKTVTTPGAQTLDFSSIDYKTVTHPLWPQVWNPFLNEELNTAARRADT